MTIPAYPTLFLVYASWFDKLRFWLHDIRYPTTDITPVDEGVVFIECSCGGHAQIRHQNDGGYAEVESATCWRWKLLLKLQRQTMHKIPTARVHKP